MGCPSAGRGWNTRGLPSHHRPSGWGGVRSRAPPNQRPPEEWRGVGQGDGCGWLGPSGSPHHKSASTTRTEGNVRAGGATAHARRFSARLCGHRICTVPGCSARNLACGRSPAGYHPPGGYGCASRGVWIDSTSGRSSVSLTSGDPTGSNRAVPGVRVALLPLLRPGAPQAQCPRVPSDRCPGSGVVGAPARPYRVGVSGVVALPRCRCSRVGPSA